MDLSRQVLHGSRMQNIDHEPQTTELSISQLDSIEQKITGEENRPMSDEINDDFMIDMPDIPMPNEEESSEVTDEFDAAFKFAFVGVGQGGSRIAEAFYKLGYRRVCAINTTNQDLTGINIPDSNKLVIGDGHGGAGKNPANGAESAAKSYEDIYDVMRRSFGTDFDRIFVCIGAGGGTGSGAGEKVIEIAHEIAQSFKIEEAGGKPAVGVIVSMPKNSEGGKVNANAHVVLNSLFKMVGSDGGKLGGRTISPLVIADNDRINKIYPKVPASQFWDLANRNISSLFHLFNTIAIKDSDFTTFDQADFKDILDSGALTFGACPIRKWDDPSDISLAIRDNLKRNVLVGGFDLTQARTAGCVFIAHTSVLDVIPQESLEHGFEMLSRTMQKGSVVHRGIYKGNKEGLVVYSILGELGRPDARLAEIAKIGNVT